MNRPPEINLPKPRIRLLLIDDEEVIHRSVGGFLQKMGYEVLHADCAEKGLQVFREQGADIVISDVRMSGLDGIGLLRELARQSRDTEVILITGHGEVDTAIQALREGAFDFFRKPVRLEELIACLERTRRFQEVRRERDRIRQRLEVLLRSDGDQGGGRMIGESQAIRKVAKLIRKVAQAERTTVLIQGESGTGKELVARAIHEESPRASAPFISVNCTAIPETLLESELFGHERGAFTDARETKKGVFELGAGGTLFLDEIGDMSTASQAKILRALEERTVRRVGGVKDISIDVRLVSATNQSLRHLMESGRFRQDLYFRLNVFTIHVPPLRERGDDALLLAYHFLKLYAAEMRKDVRHVDPSAQDLLMRYRFPGNIRELRNLIERAVILCEGTSLTEREFTDLTHHGGEGPVNPDDGSSLDLAQLEERAIRVALRRAGGSQTEAAGYLGIGHDALRYRLKKYGIP